MSVPFVVTEKVPGIALVVGQSVAVSTASPPEPSLASGLAAASGVEEPPVAASSPPLPLGPTPDPPLAPELDPPLDESDPPVGEAEEPPLDPQATGGTSAPTTEMRVTSHGRWR
jgi:hypothetical protein